jgi:molybdopterin/thiamine biosynthesis adenylyltransferase
MRGRPPAADEISKMQDQPLQPEREATRRRYARQVAFECIGPQGQSRLAAARVALIGCGALGSTLADMLVRAGVGFLRIVDRDFIELENLQRQTLFDEDDLAAGLPKAIAAQQKLARINSAVQIEAVVADANHANIERFAEGAGLLLDGTDNFETRYLINDLAVQSGRPWIYGACLGATAMMMPVLPGKTPCLRCAFGDAPPPGVSPTCEQVGILAATVHVTASLQAAEALKILIGQLDAVTRGLVSVDVWKSEFRRLSAEDASPADDCPCCGQKRFDYLSGRRGSQAVQLCGRDAVQVHPGRGQVVDLQQVLDRVASAAIEPPLRNPYLLRFVVPHQGRTVRVTLFADGRAIVQGVADPADARGVYHRYVGA